MSATDRKPDLLRGKPIRLLDLTSDAFEDFVYSTLSELGPLHGFVVAGGPAESSDSGFDLWCTRTSDQTTVCVQCKRLSSPFHLNMIGPELAKVALRSDLEGSHISEHLFVLASSTGESLRSALRETNRATIAEQLRGAVHNHKDLETLRTAVLAQGKSLDDVCARYLAQLERLRVFSGRDYDQELGRVWSRITSILDRHFTLETAIREHPRPDFDRERFLRIATSQSLPSDLPLRGQYSSLPVNLVRSRGENPLADDPGEDLADRTHNDDLIELLAGLQHGECLVLHAAGGGGKTTTLKAVEQSCARRALGDSEALVPVYVPLTDYRGSLSDCIQRALQIRHGTWLSLPHEILLLLDGLEDVGPTNAQLCLDEISRFLESATCACILTVRSSGLRQPVAVPSGTQSLRLLPLTLRHAIRHANATLPPERRDDYVSQIRSRSPRFDDLLLLPFGFATVLSDN